MSLFCISCLENGEHSGHKLTRIVKYIDERQKAWSSLKSEVTQVASQASTKYGEVQALIDYLEIDRVKDNEEEIAGDRKSVKSDFLQL